MYSSVKGYFVDSPSIVSQPLTNFPASLTPRDTGLFFAMIRFRD